MGELVVRECLESALRELGAEVTTYSSDATADAALANADQFDALIFDPWTIYVPGWRPRAPVLGREPFTFVLDFFGRSKPFDRIEKLPLHHVLTATGVVPENEFLGIFYRDAFYAEGREGREPAPAKLRAGMVWGKEPKYFRSADARRVVEHALKFAAGMGLEAVVSSVNLVRELGLKVERYEPVSGFDVRASGRPDTEVEVDGGGGGGGGGVGRVLAAVAGAVSAGATATAGDDPFGGEPAPVVHGSLKLVHSPPAKNAWTKTLRVSRFLLGVGDPLLGPSAVDALAQGCMLILPKFAVPRVYANGLLAHTQHDGVVLVAPPEYVCLYGAGGEGGGVTAEGLGELEECLRRAAQSVLPPLRIPEFTRAAHRERVRRIFERHLGRWPPTR